MTDDITLEACVRFAIQLHLYRDYELGASTTVLSEEMKMGSMVRDDAEAVALPRVGDYIRDLGPWSDQRRWTTMPTPTLTVSDVVYSLVYPVESSAITYRDLAVVHVVAPWPHDVERDEFLKEFSDRGWRWRGEEGPASRVLGGKPNEEDPGV